MALGDAHDPRHRTYRLLTFDERHFRAIVALDGQPFTLLPADR